MDAHETDQALITAAFALIAERGWMGLSLAEAARNAGVSAASARAALPDRCALLARFGRLADQAALEGALSDGPVRDRIFDVVMRRIDFLQAHRAGMLALLRDLPSDPASAFVVTAGLGRSMRWLLDGVGIRTHGLRGHLRVHGMGLIWLATVRAWREDGSEDLSATMAALDKALTRAGQAENTLADLLGRKTSKPVEASADDVPMAEAELPPDTEM